MTYLLSRRLAWSRLECANLMIMVNRSFHGALPSLLPTLDALMELCGDAQYAASVDRCQELEGVHSSADCDEDKNSSPLDFFCLRRS